MGFNLAFEGLKMKEVESFEMLGTSNATSYGRRTDSSIQR